MPASQTLLNTPVQISHINVLFNFNRDLSQDDLESKSQSVEVIRLHKNKRSFYIAFNKTDWVKSN